MEKVLITGISILFLQFTRSQGDIRGKNGYLIDTSRCKIPKFSMNFTASNATLKSCGHRKVFVRKLGEQTIEFRTHFKKCCFQFISRTKHPCKLQKTNCTAFQHGSQTALETEFLQVNCRHNKGHYYFYHDYFAFVKKKPSNRVHDNSYNVLIIGMDSMSRARARKQMPLTVDFLSTSKWLDFKGYHKVADEAYSKMAFLSNKNMSTLSKACKPSLSDCNKMLVWKEFEKAGYVTAYGEDAIFLPQTTDFKFHFQVPPTKHYMKPLFMAGEKEQDNTVCTPQISSGEQVINYINDFVQTYKTQKFFGFFWINSFSHSTNPDYSPTLIDGKMAYLFKEINSLGLHKNTFVIFFSDHGILYGPNKFSAESYYEERLPMLYIKVPITFQQTYPAKYFNLKTNIQRLVSPYDVHLTLRELATNITEAAAPVGKHDSCPRCRTLFREITDKRSCSDAGIDEKWCTCHEMRRTKGTGTRKFNDYSAYYSLVQSVLSLHNKTQSIVTKRLISPCPELKLKKVLRVHYYEDTHEFNNYKTYYVIAMMMDPENVTFEAIVRKDEDRTYEILQPIETLTDFTKRIVCTLDPLDMKYCVCIDTMKKCLQGRHRKTPKAKCPFTS